MSILLHFYCDEISHRGHQYADVGGLACRPERINAIDQEIGRLKTAHNYRSEIKWEKVSRRYLPFFEDMTEYFFSFIDAIMFIFMSYYATSINMTTASTMTASKKPLLVKRIISFFYTDCANVMVKSATCIFGRIAATALVIFLDIYAL